MIQSTPASCQEGSGDAAKPFRRRGSAAPPLFPNFNRFTCESKLSNRFLSAPPSLCSPTQLISGLIFCERFFYWAANWLSWFVSCCVSAFILHLKVTLCIGIFFSLFFFWLPLRNVTAPYWVPRHFSKTRDVKLVLGKIKARQQSAQE